MDKQTAGAIERLKALLEQRGSNIHQLAKRLKIRPASFSEGRLKPHWIKIANDLNCSLDWLVFGKNDLATENARLIAVIADLSAKLQPGSTEAPGHKTGPGPDNLRIEPDQVQQGPRAPQSKDQVSGVPRSSDHKSRVKTLRSRKSPPSSPSDGITEGTNG